jgi:hypothetical protein
MKTYTRYSEGFKEQALVRIPVQSDHQFQTNAATHSVLKRPPNPVNTATLW